MLSEEERRLRKNERNKRWIQNNHDAFLQNRKNAYQARKARNPEKVNMQSRESRQRTFEKNPTLQRQREREASLKKKYKITNDDYDKIFEAQNGCCKICGKISTRALCVDHDHKTGKIRGLLCDQCNTALGFMDDSPSILRRAIAYLKGKL